ncbi:MAG: HAD-IIIC family phosphatase [Lachnospiraceae bacterium]|nr:HAD-IIIC family phosphatase [Lachnospiraceae bacterium]
MADSFILALLLMCKFNNFFINQHTFFRVIKKIINFAHSKEANMEMSDIGNVKLVIWDLDDTFWKGTLSEGPVTLIKENVEAIKWLVDHGVMNSIVSKNNFEDAKRELEKHGLWEYFVFPSIDWTPKGARVKGVIEDMALRPDNALFIDDNAMNLREAQFILPKLMTLDAADIASFWEALPRLKKQDLSHKRLSQYRILESKRDAKSHSASIGDFLRESQIRVSMRPAKESDLDRIHEMVMRTNQLNFTKNRCSKEDLEKQFASPAFDLGVVEASDKYGDYGIVGFYSLDKATRRLKHFLFSCRTLGMGVEQYVYQQLGFPELEIVGDVANKVEPKAIVDWINLTTASEAKEQKAETPKGRKLKVLLKGPCDMAGTIDFLNTAGITLVDELNYVNDRGVSITGFNHTSNILQGINASKEGLNSLVAQAPMIDHGIFRTRLFEEDWDVVFLSLLPDSHEGVYRRKSDGLRFSFSSFNFDFTNPANWDAILAGKVNAHNYKFSREDLENLRRDFTFIGHLPAKEIADNVQTIAEKLPKSTALVLFLGNTRVTNDNPNPEFKGQAGVNKEINKEIKARFADSPRIRIIDYTDMAEEGDGSEANHLSRRARYRTALAMQSILGEISDRPAASSANMPYSLVMVKRTFKRIFRLLNRKKKTS